MTQIRDNMKKINILQGKRNFRELLGKSRKRLFGMAKKVQGRNQKVKPEVIEREVAEAVRASRTKSANRNA